MRVPGEPMQESISWAQVRKVFDSTPVNIALVGRDRRYRYVNSELAKFIGKPEDAILGRTVAEVLGLETFAAVSSFGDRALAGETVDGGSWVEYPQGRRYVRRISVPLYDAAGTVEGYFIFVRDLTDLRQIEQNLAEQSAARSASEAINAAIIAAATDCVVTLDEAGRVVEFNPAAERTFGRKRAEVLGQNIDELIVPPHQRRRYGESFARFVASGAPMDGAPRSRRCEPTVPFFGPR
jgi:two-component system NtrC family sensor kinase